MNLTAVSSDTVMSSVISMMEKFPKDEGLQTTGCHTVATIDLGLTTNGMSAKTSLTGKSALS